MRRRTALAALGGIALAGCGFELRRAPELRFSSLALAGFKPKSTLADELRRQIGTSTTTIVAATVTSVTTAPAPIMAELARWLVEVENAVAESSFEESLTRSNEPKEGWARQLIATLDDWTTETCINVHGQIRAFGVPFDLCCDPWTSARNYGFSNMRPPFHWWCRTEIGRAHV